MNRLRPIRLPGFVHRIGMILRYWYLENTVKAATEGRMSAHEFERRRPELHRMNAERSSLRERIGKSYWI